MQVAAERRTARALAEGDRRSAMGVLAGSILGRVWLVTLSILLVGGLAEREDGLAAAILSAVLVTVSFAIQALARLLEPEQDRGMKTRTKVLLGIGLYVAFAIALGILFGSAGKNDEFKPQNEFKVEPWINIKIGGIDLSINKVGPLPRSWPAP